MGEVVGEILPLAIGVAISPVPIIAVILMLLAPRAGGASRGFLVSWIIGILVGVIVITVLADVTELDKGSGGSTAAGIIKLLLGVGVLALAWRQWHSRPKEGETPAMPAWLSAIDSVTPPRAVALGFALSAINPKNLAMLLAAGVAIGGSALGGGQITLTIVIFTILSASTVAIPVIIYATARERTQTWLNSLKAWLTANNNTVMMVLLGVIGVVLIGKGIAGL